MGLEDIAFAPEFAYLVRTKVVGMPDRKAIAAWFDTMGLLRGTDFVVGGTIHRDLGEYELRWDLVVAFKERSYAVLFKLTWG